MGLKKEWTMKVRRIAVVALAAAVAGLLSTGVAVAAAKPAPEGKVNLNTATTEQLTALPGVGPKLAARIVEHRQKSGAFKSVQELMNVKGISEKSFEKIEGHLTLGEPGRTPSSK
jgi:competence protein ComEA